jgi:hypothetical protein
VSPMTAATGRRERDLVHLCARLALEGEARERATELLARPLDWDTVLKWAGFHHVTPLLYRHVNDLGHDDVDTEVLEDLRTRSRGIAARNLNLTLELISILGSLEAAGAPGVIWKGPALAYTLYPSPELRTFSDLDIILRPEDRHRARNVLNERGYRASSESFLNEDELFGKGSHDATLWNPETRISVDLHWGLVPRYRAPVADFRLLWSRSTKFTVLGSELRVLEPGIHLLALCAHGAKHGPFPWPALKWITDVEAYLRTYPPEWWGPVLQQARKEGCLRMLLLGLALAEDVLGAPLPRAVSVALDRQSRARGLVPGIRRRILNPQGASFPLGERVAFDLAVRERWRDRMAYRAMRLFTPSPRDLAPGRRTSFRLSVVALRLLRLGRTYLLRPRALRTLLRRADSGSGSDPVGGKGDR